MKNYPVTYIDVNYLVANICQATDCTDVNEKDTNSQYNRK